MMVATSAEGHVSDLIAWRQAFHREPELGYRERDTARRVAALLRSFGIDEVLEGIGGTGVVGLIRGGPGPVIALRAELDALPISEAGRHPHRSRREGVMHACGHDGHMAMLLGAARQLRATRAFAGTVAVIFQPAEEGLAGAQAMIDDGLLDRVPLESIFALHNMPGLPVGQIAISPGPVMAANDLFDIEVAGAGGHAAMPDLARDPIPAAAMIVTIAQSLISRNMDPREACVLSITGFASGEAQNAIPGTAHLRGTVRSLAPYARALVRDGLERIVQGTAAAHDVRAVLDYRPGRPATVNTRHEAALVRLAAERLAAAGSTITTVAEQRPVMASEDFSLFLQHRPGAFAFLGVGEGHPPLHSPDYDFNDAVLPIGVALLCEIATGALADRAGKGDASCTVHHTGQKIV